MLHDIKLFSQKLRNLRETFHISKKEIENKTGISRKTITRLESAKSIPNLYTLGMLSSLYKTDLINLFDKCQFQNYSMFNSTITDIERKIDNLDLNNLNLEIKALEKLLKSTNNTYYKNYIFQLKLFIEGLTLCNNNDFKSATATYIRALKITEPKFNLDEYYNFVLSIAEIRILMNISMIINKSNGSAKGLEILLFCEKNLDETEILYSKICNNIANIYSKLKNYIKALKYYNKGIVACRKSRQLAGLALLYYGKGCTEYNLNRDNYCKSLIISITLCEAFKQDKLYKEIINKCKKYCGIALIDNMELKTRISQVQ